MAGMKTEPPLTASDPESIKGMFQAIAHRYDVGNAINSMMMHRLWNRRLVNKVLMHRRCNAYLDLCSGTGDIAYNYLQRTLEKPDVYLLDFCPEMLWMAEKKAERPPLADHNIRFVEGDATNLPFESALFDAVTVAYGIRNVKSPAKLCEEVMRTLTPGGRFGILEVTCPKTFPLKHLHKLYLKTVLPTVGRFLTKNQSAYRYLCESIQSFVSPRKLARIVSDAGFVNVQRTSLMGGIATIIIGDKPT